MISKDIQLKFVGEKPGAQCLTVANTHDYGQNAIDLSLTLNEMDLEAKIGCGNCAARLDRKKPPCVKAYTAGNSQVNILCTITSDEKFYTYPKPCQADVVVRAGADLTQSTVCSIETSQPVQLINWVSLSL